MFPCISEVPGARVTFKHSWNVLVSTCMCPVIDCPSIFYPHDIPKYYYGAFLPACANHSETERTNVWGRLRGTFSVSVLFRPDPASSTSFLSTTSLTYSLSPSLYGRGSSESEGTEGHRSGTVKWVTFSTLVHLMSNSDKLCSALPIDKQTDDMFSSKQVLDTKTQKNMYSNTAAFQRQKHSVCPITRGWQISIQAG